MKVSTDKIILLECFYTSQSEEIFTAEKSQQFLLHPNDSELISFSLPVEHLYKLRIDVGDRPGRVHLGNIKIPGFASLDYSGNISTHGIDSLIVNKYGGVIIHSRQDDPYLIFNEPLNIDVNKSLNVNKSGFLIAIIISFLAFALFYTLFSYLETLQTNRLDLILLVIFFALLLVPAYKINKEDVSVEENRSLAKYPEFIVDNHINSDFGTAFETYFNDRFFMRKALVRMNKSIENKINTNQQNDYILIGKEGWAFCKDDGGVQNYQNLKLFSPEELKHIAQYLSSIDNWCKTNDKKFYYLIAPDKNKIYGEYYKYARKVRPDSESRTQQLIRYLQKHTNVKVVYPYDALIEAKKKAYLLYFKNDIHWCHLGAYCAYTELMKLISSDFEIKPITFEKLSTYKFPHGDATILFPEAVKNDTITLYHCPVFPIYYTLSGDLESKKTLYYHNPKGNHTAVFFRDSFATLLADYYFGNTFEQLSMKWQYKITKEDLQFVKDKKAEIVVLEQVEKFVPKLLSAEILNN